MCERAEKQVRFRTEELFYFPTPQIIPENRDQSKSDSPAWETSPYIKPEPVSPLTRTPLNVQTKAQLKNFKDSKIVESPKHKKKTKFGPKTPHFNRTM